MVAGKKKVELFCNEVNKLLSTLWGENFAGRKLCNFSRNLDIFAKLWPAENIFVKFRKSLWKANLIKIETDLFEYV